MATGNAELVAAIIRGEIHRYTEIVRRFDNQVRQVVYQEVQDPATREDLVQETFYRGFTNLHQLRECDRVESWLVMIARNCVRDHFRNSGRRQRMEQASGQQSTNETGQAPGTSTWIWHEVDRLAPRFAQILRLRYWQGMSYDEIAKQLDVPLSTVRGRIFEARKSLRERLIKLRLFP